MLQHEGRWSSLHVVASPYEKDNVSAAANTPLLALLLRGDQPPLPLQKELLASPRRQDPFAARAASHLSRHRTSPCREKENVEMIAALPIKNDKKGLPFSSNPHTRRATPAEGLEGTRQGGKEEDEEGSSSRQPPRGDVASNDDDGQQFRSRVRETERRLKEQMAVHRGITQALRDVEEVQREARVLTSEEKLSLTLALLRSRQEQLFDRAGGGGAVGSPTGQPAHPRAASSSVGAAAAASPVLSVGFSPTPTALPSAVYVFPTHAPSPTASSAVSTPAATSAASPLRDILEAFSKPRAAKRSAIPSPPPISGGTSGQHAAGSTDREKGRRQVSAPTHRCDVVDLREEVPRPYVQVRWVPRRHTTEDAGTDSSLATTTQDGGRETPLDGLTSVPLVEQTRAHGGPLGISSGQEEVYDDDFENSETDSETEGVEAAAGEQGSTITEAEEAKDESMTEDTTMRDGQARALVGGRRASAADSSVLTASLVTSAAGTSPSASIKTTEEGEEEGDEEEDAIDAAYPSSLSNTHERRNVGRRAPEGDATLAQTLAAFHEVCQGANRLVERLGYRDAEITPGPGPSAARATPPSTTTLSGPAVERLMAEFANVRRLRRFIARLRAGLGVLDVERRAHRAKRELLRKAQVLARARRALTEDEEAVLQEVLPPGVDAEALLAAARASRHPVLSEKNHTRQARRSREAARRRASGVPSSSPKVLREEDSSILSDISDTIASTMSDRIEEDIIVTDSGADGASTVASDGLGEESSIATEEGTYDITDDSAAPRSTAHSIPEEVDADVSDGSRLPDSRSSRSSLVEEVEDGQGWDDLEEAVQRAIDEHAIAHVFRKQEQRLAERDSRQRAITAAAADRESIIEEDLENSSSLLDSAEERLANRLADSSVTSVSQLLSDTSVAEAIGELPTFRDNAKHDGRGHSDNNDSEPIATVSEINTVTSGTPVRLPTVSEPTAEKAGESQRHPPARRSTPTAKPSASTNLTDPSTRDNDSDARLSATTRTIATMRSSPPYPQSSGDSASSTAVAPAARRETVQGGQCRLHLASSTPSQSLSTLLEAGEEELRDLEADIEATRHRRRTALRTVRRAPAQERRSTDGGGGEGSVVPTFTQLYDPNDSTLTSLLMSGASDLDEAPALRGQQQQSSRGQRGDVLLRLRALRDGAADKSYKGKRIFFAERDLLQSAGSLAESHAPEGESLEAEARSVSHRKEVGTEAPVLLSASGGGGDRKDEAVQVPDATSVSRKAAEVAPDERGSMPNLAEDFVALGAWKQQQLSLFAQLRSAADSAEEDRSGSDREHKQTGNDEEGGLGSFAYHWGVLHSLLETRFARRTDPNNNDDGDDDSGAGATAAPPSQRRCCYYYPSLLEHEAQLSALCDDDVGENASDTSQDSAHDADESA